MLNNKIDFSKYDPKLWFAIEQEKKRQENHIELIASENYTSNYVMDVQGSQLTNKYAEGYPGKRYYGGCEYVDIIEELAIERAKKLFNADYANVQPHSGSQANFSVYTALLNPGDTILGMKLSHGGHLTHGSSVNFSGKMYNVISYGVDENGEINYEELLRLTKKYKPKMIIGGFSAYSGICNWKKMRFIADNADAYFVVDMAHVAGLVAAGIYPNPINYAHVVTSTTHKTLAGPRGGLILAKNGDDILYKKLNLSVFPGAQGGPLMHVIAAKAIAFKEALEPKFKTYQKQIVKNSKVMVERFLEKGYKIISGHTFNHLFLIDLTNKKITGKDADIILSKANITVNKNTIPNDLKSPFITSGIRIGTAAVTRRGFKENEVSRISDWITSILNNVDDHNNVLQIKKKVLEMCLKYPVYI
ncbi:serine hydroxymethyltransferase [Buchnera aphidicola str. APS (Acyrthosiphon pisum)]|uniref:Serine hydroxymethyltransferase n=1 Tax=Buchnera aphidicola subsp. Acyrthosiphon pisum (strain APS) TaxID=107806 RepID=GLYA_BUCAI|nr:serine hydroxymethyltransferase [Buchnera aphidicola]P57376.1 RecName: Full=Serine hydroxymethyltransferase; Short=SHMT; Short=Serine methylase [Buchnera aphidicola str. APS (Acyrthosiphon pisum)]pir/G84963/ glycine hydroxymethyltransferase (EC 2.1.2.1) [imported] - Buchnera sp. (strain APS) [Buchnera sp. (in: enterobacteria)]BAB12999.1 serine hydroxymethyltransferase [Buchnera aphidicola str. APS (Acyrthosiphon pisum)]